MANQCEFVQPELLLLVLKQVNLAEQFNLRRVNKDFKQVIEDRIWPMCKKLTIATLYYKNSYNGWKIMLSHMSKIKVVFVEKVMSSYLDKEHFCTLLAEYCQGIRKFVGYDGYCKPWAVEYVKQLSKLGVYDTNVLFRIDVNASLEELDGLSPESKFMIDIFDATHIPAHYHDKILSFDYGYLTGDPYLPNLKGVGTTDYSNSEDEIDDFIQTYHSQITKINHRSLGFVDKIHRFPNLKCLILNPGLVYVDLSLKNELEYIKTLKRYLESNASHHLNSLVVSLRHISNAIWLIEILSSLDRPSKWHRLAIKCYECDYSTSLSVSRNMFMFDYESLSVPMTWITNLFERIRPPKFINLCFGCDLSNLSKMQFDNWKQWIATYAAKHRNKQIVVEMRPSFDNGRTNRIEVVGDNWSLEYPQHMHLM